MPVIDERYLLETMISQKGHCDTWRGIQLSTGAPIIAKTMRLKAGGLPDSDERSAVSEKTWRARFTAEFEALRQLRHPHVSQLLDHGEDANFGAWSIFAPVDGVHLAQQLAAGVTFEPRRAARVMLQVADALDAVHRCGALHGSLSPESVIVGRMMGAEHAVLTEFGFTATSRTATRATHFDDRTRDLYTVSEFAAPEQAVGQEATSRTDIYAWGMTLAALLTPQRSARSESLDGGMAGVERVPAELRAIISRCTQRDPSARYGSASQVVTDLQAWLSQAPVEAAPPTFRHRRFLLLAAAVALAVGGIAFALSHSAGVPSGGALATDIGDLKRLKSTQVSDAERARTHDDGARFRSRQQPHGPAPSVAGESPDREASRRAEVGVADGRTTRSDGDSEDVAIRAEDGDSERPPSNTASVSEESTEPRVTTGTPREIPATRIPAVRRKPGDGRSGFEPVETPPSNVRLESDGACAFGHSEWVSGTVGDVPLRLHPGLAGRGLSGLPAGAIQVALDPRSVTNRVDSGSRVVLTFYEDTAAEATRRPHAPLLPRLQWFEGISTRTVDPRVVEGLKVRVTERTGSAMCVEMTSTSRPGWRIRSLVVLNDTTYQRPIIPKVWRHWRYFSPRVMARGGGGTLCPAPNLVGPIAAAKPRKHLVQSSPRRNDAVKLNWASSGKSDVLRIQHGDITHVVTGLRLVISTELQSGWADVTLRSGRVHRVPLNSDQGLVPTTMTLIASDLALCGSIEIADHLVTFRDGGRRK